MSRPFGCLLQHWERRAAADAAEKLRFAHDRTGERRLAQPSKQDYGLPHLDGDRGAIR